MRRFGLAGLVLLASVSCKKEPLTNSELSKPPIEWLTSTAQACSAAAQSQKPILFFWAADWDIATADWQRHALLDPRVRGVVNHRYVALRVDRTRTWSDEPMTPEESRNVEEARDRFDPWASKYGSLMIIAADCRTRRDDLSGIHDPELLARRLVLGSRRG